MHTPHHAMPDAEHQEHLFRLLQALSESHDALSWRRHWCALDDAVRLLLGARVPAAQAGADIASAIAELRWPSWDDDDVRLARLQSSLARWFSRARPAFADFPRHRPDDVGAGKDFIPARFSPRQPVSPRPSR